MDVKVILNYVYPAATAFMAPNTRHLFFLIMLIFHEFALESAFIFAPSHRQTHPLCQRNEALIFEYLVFFG